MAIDRDAIISEVYQGAGQKAKNPIPPTMWSYDEATVDIPFDPDKAKEMLKAAGVENLKTDIWWMPVQRPYNPNAKRMAEMMQADLAKVGIDATLVSYEWGEYLKRAKAGEHQADCVQPNCGAQRQPDSPTPGQTMLNPHTISIPFRGQNWNSRGHNLDKSDICFHLNRFLI